jgi:hypothetical protein
MQLPEGKYITKARLDANSAFYGEYIPTYFGDVLAWEQAVPVTLNTTNWECDISLIQSVGIPFGKGEIVGSMLYDTLISHPLVPADDIEVVLLGVEGSHLTCKLSDLYGTFEFSDLAYGTYQLFPDVAGIYNTPVYITISENKPVADDFSLVINLENVTYLGINDPEPSIVSVHSLYPNPAKDFINLEFEMKVASEVEIIIVDPAGRCMLVNNASLDKGEQNVRLNINDLATGFYQVYMIAGHEAGWMGKFIVAE